MHALSIDFEEWYHHYLLAGKVPESKKKSLIEESINWILREASKRNSKLTFFVVGELIGQHKDLLREIYHQGHEIACHGYTHKPLWQLTRKEFSREIKDFKREIWNIDNSIKIYGFRAPTFSLTKETAWALDILEEENFLYDSSLFPFRNYIYGIAHAPLSIFKTNITDPSSIDERGQFVEVPLTVYEYKGFRVPIAGGFYMRLLPQPIHMRLLKKVAKERSLILYIHPWEFIENNPRVKTGIFDSFIIYYGISKMKNKLLKLLDSFEFSTILSVVRKAKYD